MKTIVMIMLLCVASVSAEAKSVKLGFEDSIAHGAKQSGAAKKPAMPACVQNSDCMTGWKCDNKRCRPCKKGEKECDCAFEMVGFGVCGCPEGTFNDGTKCRDYCDSTVCEADYPNKKNDGRQCCCEK